MTAEVGFEVLGGVVLDANLAETTGNYAYRVISHLEELLESVAAIILVVASWTRLTLSARST